MAASLCAAGPRARPSATLLAWPRDYPDGPALWLSVSISSFPGLHGCTFWLCLCPAEAWAEFQATLWGSGKDPTIPAKSPGAVQNGLLPPQRLRSWLGQTADARAAGPQSPPPPRPRPGHALVSQEGHLTHSPLSLCCLLHRFIHSFSKHLSLGTAHNVTSESAYVSWDSESGPIKLFEGMSRQWSADPPPCLSIS